MKKPQWENYSLLAQVAHAVDGPPDYSGYFYPMEQQILIDLVTKRMPFGKYKDRLLCDVPEHYLVWMKGKGFPEGKLGMWLNTLYEIRLNGLEDILVELKKNYR